MAALHGRGIDQLVFLLDCSELCSATFGTLRERETLPACPSLLASAGSTHHLDSLDKLLECQKQLMAMSTPRSPKFLVFTSKEGFRSLQGAFAKVHNFGLDLAFEPSEVQCVPSGCKVADFMLELGLKRAREGCRVIIVSNADEIQTGCAEGPPTLSRLGFMLADGDLLIPGFEKCSRQEDHQNAKAGEPAHQADRSRSPRASISICTPTRAPRSRSTAHVASPRTPILYKG